jgi:hypothetical protein
MAQGVLGLPTMADIGCAPFCDADQTPLASNYTLQVNGWYHPLSNLDCLGQAWGKNWKSLTIDAAGVGVMFLPGGAVVQVSANLALAGLSAMAVEHGNNMMAGAAINGIFGTQIGALEKVGFAPRAMKRLGWGSLVVGIGYDGSRAISDFLSCKGGY